MKKSIVSILFASVAALNVSAADGAKVDLTPHIHGALRTRWEMDTEEGDYRFQVRNARVTLDGNVTSWANYFIQTDLCDAGKMKILDAYARLYPTEGFMVKAGQFRMPFGVETFRSPQNYIFANRSFMGKQVMNYRQIGAQLSYTLPKAPLTLEFGAFNPSTISDHNTWNNTLAYSGRATYKAGEWSLCTGYASIRPYEFRANLVDFAISWDNTDHWLLAAEYMHETYCNHVGKSVDAWVGYADWHTAVKVGAFDRWSIQVREDGMTDHLAMDGAKVEPARNRVTLGSTLTYGNSKIRCDVRVNYEKYFYHHDYKAPVGDGDKIVAELVLRF